VILACPPCPAAHDPARASDRRICNLKLDTSPRRRPDLCCEPQLTGQCPGNLHLDRTDAHPGPANRRESAELEHLARHQSAPSPPQWPQIIGDLASRCVRNDVTHVTSAVRFWRACNRRSGRPLRTELGSRIFGLRCCCKAWGQPLVRGDRVCFCSVDTCQAFSMARIGLRAGVIASVCPYSFAWRRKPFARGGSHAGSQWPHCSQVNRPGPAVVMMLGARPPGSVH
jgi:hypothetical protein